MYMYIEYHQCPGFSQHHILFDIQSAQCPGALCHSGYLSGAVCPGALCPSAVCSIIDTRTCTYEFNQLCRFVYTVIYRTGDPFRLSAPYHFGRKYVLQYLYDSRVSDRSAPYHFCTATI